MYKCYHCGAIFYETSLKEEDSTSVPAPFGIGTVEMAGGIFDCCPECKSYHFDELYFDGIHCPYCSEVIDLKCIKDENNCEFTCEKCGTEFCIEDGEVESAYRE